MHGAPGEETLNSFHVQIQYSKFEFGEAHIFFVLCNDLYRSSHEIHLDSDPRPSSLNLNKPEEEAARAAAALWVFDKEEEEGKNAGKIMSSRKEKEGVKRLEITLCFLLLPSPVLFRPLDRRRERRVNLLPSSYSEFGVQTALLH